MQFCSLDYIRYFEMGYVGDALRIRAKGWTDRLVVNVLDWDVAGVFNDNLTKMLAPSHDAG